MLKDRILSFVNKPEGNILSSQTLYQSLMALSDLFELTGEEYWRTEAGIIAGMIIKNQLPDGGFDIGYDFMFGKGLNKKSHREATTPEVLSIYALYRYGELFGYDEVLDAIEKGIKWILGNVIRIPGNKYAIPYAPGTYENVHITNGVSFTIGVLGFYLRLNRDPKAEEIFKGMVKFMKEELHKNEYGYYWPYFYSGPASERSSFAGQKTDNYHIGQQLRYHSSAYKNFPTEENYEIIDSVSKYLLNRIDEEGILPYTEARGRTSTGMNLWGYSSVIKGLMDAYGITNNSALEDKARLMVSFILKNAWNGDYFYPIIDKNGSVLDKNFYPRSDAWVLHSLAHYMNKAGYDEKIYKVCRASYNKIRRCNFRGLENHTLTLRKRVFARLMYLLSGFLKRAGKN